MALRKSRNRVIFGCLGGIAEYFRWDPTLVRIIYVLLSILSAAFPGLLIYFILFLLMPAANSEG